MDRVSGQHTNVPFIVELVEDLEQPRTTVETTEPRRIRELDRRPAVEADAPTQRLVHLGRHVGDFDGGDGRCRISHVAGLVAAVLPAHAAQIVDMKGPAERGTDVQIQHPVTDGIGALRADDDVEPVNVEMELDAAGVCSSQLVRLIVQEGLGLRRGHVGASGDGAITMCCFAYWAAWAGYVHDVVVAETYN